MPQRDLVLHNGRVITLDGRSTIAEAVAVRDGRVRTVGPSAAVLKDAAAETRVIDLAGRTVIPGLLDAHAHMDRVWISCWTFSGGSRTRGCETSA